MRPWLAPLALILLTAAVYARSLAVPILGGDDHVYLFRDPRLERLSLESLGRILTQPFFANFHPLTTLTYALDRAMWGSWVPGFHITQLLFYVGGVLGVYFLFRRILGSSGAALAGSALYAVHPVHVESVAWLASRKDVVCLFFYALALLAYTRYARGGRKAWVAYLLSVALGAAAMLSKGYAAALPAVLLAYDLCFLPRVTSRQLVDKVPFAALAILTLLLTVHAQDRDSALIDVALTLEQRLAILLKVFALYVGNALLPLRLSAFYTVGGQPVEGPLVLLGLVLALAMVAGFFALRRRLPAVAFGIALYLLPLATVMNVWFTLRIWMTDRYLLFPTIGSSLVLAALGARALQRRAARRGPRSAAPARLATALAMVAVLTYSLLTVDRIGVWTSGVRLWSDVMRKELRLDGSGPVRAAELQGIPRLAAGVSTPLLSLIQSYRSEGRPDEAERLEVLLDRVAGSGGESGELTLAQRDLDAGNWDAALRRLRPIAESPSSWLAPEATLMIGLAQRRVGDEEGSARSLRRAIELYRAKGRPVTDGLLEIGTSEFRQGRFAQAAEWYRLAHRESQRDAKAAFHLGRALEEAGSVAEAMAIYRRIVGGELPILPESQFTVLDVYLQMAVAAEKLGWREESAGYFEEVLRRAPDHPKRDAILAQIRTLRSARSQPESQPGGG